MFTIQDSISSGNTGRTMTTVANGTGAKKKQKKITIPTSEKDSSVAATRDTSYVVFTDTLVFPEKDKPVTSRDTHPELFLVRKQDTDALPLTDLFGEHVLVPTKSMPVKKEALAPEWLFPLILVMLGMLTWLRIFYIRSFKRMFTALFNINLANQIVRDENILLQKATVYLNMLFCMSGALFLYTISLKDGWSPAFAGNGIYLYLFFMGLILAIYFLKYIVLKFCGWLFDLERELSTYLFTVYLTNNLAGLLIFPIAIVMSFNPDLDSHLLTRLAFILIGIAYSMRLLRGITIGWSVHQVRPLYIIFYLCTLELAPLSILLRLVARC